MHSANAQVHKFFYCSRGGHSVKRVHPALEMEACREEQGGLVCFLVAAGAGTREIHRRLSAVYGEQCIIA